MNFEDLCSFVRGSQVFDLGVELFPGMPHVPVHAPYGFTLNREHGDMMISAGACSAVEAIFCTGHTGTHIDAFSHYSKDMKLFGGIDVRENQSKTEGMKAHGIETVAPFVQRGVMLDMAGHMDKEILDGGFGIGPRELEAAASAQGVRIEVGDVVLLRTGMMKTWPGRQYYFQEGGQPGLNLDGAKWLSSRGIRMVGSDTYCVEVRPDPASPVHVHMLVESGIHLLEIAVLEELARTKTYEFLFVAIPLKIKGGTGSPVRPVAIV
jgi:kynurenine formamidase